MNTLHTWHWQTWQELPYLTCDLLESWSHGFFTRHFSPRVPQDLVHALDPEATVYRVKQVHGNTVLAPAELQEALDAESGLSQADGLLTNGAGQAIWVCSADCTPVLIADAHTGQVSAVHAGWRGTAAKIVPLAIARLQAQGSQLSHLRVALGPAIAGEVYQVDTEVAATVGATIAQADHPDELLEELHNLPQAPVLPDPEPGKVRLDVRRVITLQLEQLGFSPEQIAIAPHCTYQQPEDFFSYRRHPEKKVQWSGIVSRSVMALLSEPEH